MRDFSQTFDAYAEFEESITKARMEALEKSPKVTDTGKFILRNPTSMYKAQPDFNTR